MLSGVHSAGQPVPRFHPPRLALTLCVGLLVSFNDLGELYSPAGAVSIRLSDKTMEEQFHPFPPGIEKTSPEGEGFALHAGNSLADYFSSLVQCGHRVALMSISLRQ